MYSNIVKIKQEEVEKYGTGIVIDSCTVITAEHVISPDERVNVEYLNETFKGDVIFHGNDIALIKIHDLKFKDLFYEQSDTLFFTDQEIFSEEDRVEIEGYRSYLLIEHSLSGKGIYPSNNTLIHCDYEVGSIIKGKLQDYSGLSGSPIILNSRAVGIVQIQVTDQSGVLGIGFTSINKFRQYLPGEAITQSKYIDELLDTSKSQTLCEIEKNKKSAKYIPSIFVEDDIFKENMRYFSDPILFLSKSIDELQSLDYSNINKVLKGEEISFAEYSEKISPNNFFNQLSNVDAKIKHYINIIEIAKKKIDYNDSENLEDFFIHRSMFNNSIEFKLKQIANYLEFISKRIVVITNNAGQGKTNFLCDFTSNFLVKRNIPTFYFNASSFIENPATEILEVITINNQWEKEYVKKSLMKLWEITGTFIVIVIDGLNENTTLNNFGNYIKSSISELLKYPYIKIILSTRNEKYDERFGMLSDDNFGRQFCRMNMRQFRSDLSKKRIFKGYLKFFDVEILESTLPEAVYDQLTRDTLLLRFFCEVNKKKRQVHLYDIYKYSLFQKYYDLKKLELINSGNQINGNLFDKLIEHIAEIMIDTKEFSHIRLDELNSEDLQIAYQLLESDVIFKTEFRLKKGFVEDVDEIISFTFDEFRDYCLTRYIVRLEKAAEIFPKFWRDMDDNKWSILEGVQKYIFFLSRTESSEIENIIKKYSNYSSIYWKNIWNLEDSYIREDDIQLWKKHLFNVGPYSIQICKFLINRRDRGYFKNSSIDVLFDFLLEFSKTPGKYDVIIRKLFPFKINNRYEQAFSYNNYVILGDEFIKRSIDNFEILVERRNYVDALKLSIFIYHIMPNLINDLWQKAYSIIPSESLEILEEYVGINNTYIFIKKNVNDILSVLNEANCNNRICNLKSHIIEDNYRSIFDQLTNIWEK